MTLGPPVIFEPTDRLDARVTLLSSARPLENRARVRFHQGTLETTAEITLLDRDELTANGSAWAQLRLGEKTLLLPGDRFILRQFSPAATLGGGVVIDVKAPRHRRREVSISKYLEALEKGSRTEILQAMAAVAPNGLALGEILARTGWFETEIRDAASSLCENGHLRISRRAAADRCLRFVSGKLHIHAAIRCRGLSPGESLCCRASPGRSSVRESEIRRLELFETSLRDLLAAGALNVSGDIVQRSGRRVELTPEESLAKERSKKNSSRPDWLCRPLPKCSRNCPWNLRRAQKILQILIREKILVKVTAELVFHRASMSHLRALLVRYRQSHGARLPIPAFKELTGISRKYAIPLLEYLDRERVTRRVGNERVIL